MPNERPTDIVDIEELIAKDKAEEPVLAIEKMRRSIDAVEKAFAGVEAETTISGVGSEDYKPDWRPVSEGVPLNIWLRTRHESEEGENLCTAVMHMSNDPIEWIEGKTFRTTVTHGSFAAPTHWAFPDPTIKFDARGERLKPLRERCLAFYKEQGINAMLRQCDPVDAIVQFVISERKRND